MHSVDRRLGRDGTNARRAEPRGCRRRTSGRSDARADRPSFSSRDPMASIGFEVLTWMYKHDIAIRNSVNVTDRRLRLGRADGDLDG